MEQALRKRGIPELTAHLAAELGSHAFSRAFDQWTESAAGPPLTRLARRALEELRTAAAALD
jgi:hypothetical protein